MTGQPDIALPLAKSFGYTQSPGVRFKFPTAVNMRVLCVSAFFRPGTSFGCQLSDWQYPVRGCDKGDLGAPSRVLVLGGIRKPREPARQSRGLSTEAWGARRLPVTHQEGGAGTVSRAAGAGVSGASAAPQCVWMGLTCVTSCGPAPGEWGGQLVPTLASALAPQTFHSVGRGASVPFVT